jgi:hypothetical protein
VNEPERQSRTPWYIAGAALAVAAVVVIVALVAGGGSDDSGSASTNVAGEDTFPPQVVRTSEIEAQDVGSPQRALLQWWQSFQFADAQGVASSTSPGTVDAIGRAQLAQLVKTRGQGLQGVEVLGASVDGDTASVRVGLLTFQPEKQGEPPPDTPTASRPATFAMRKDGDEWQFSDTAFLRPLIQGLENQQKQKQQKQGSQEQTKTQTTETAPE